MSKHLLTALVAAAFAVAAPSASAGDLSISIGGPHFGVTYTKVHGHHHGHVVVAPPRVCPPRVVVHRSYARRYVAPPCPPRVVTRVVHAPPVAHAHHAYPVHGYGKTTYKTKHKVKVGKKKTKVFTKHKTVYHH